MSAEATASSAAAEGQSRPVAPLQVTGITHRWPGSANAVLDGVGFTAARGEALWITGGNGAGKTTLLRIITGILAPNAGEVTILGRSLAGDRAAMQERLGFLAAGNSGLYARLSVRQHLAFWADLAFVPASERGARVARALAEFDLDPLASRRTDRLSMGQRQRLRLAMTFLHSPDVVLLDEPLTSLDSAGAAILEQTARALLDRGGALLWCSPDGAQPEWDFHRRLTLREGHLEEV